jgi:hypothetical protein
LVVGGKGVLEGEGERANEPAGSTGLVSSISAAWRVWRMLVLGGAAPAVALRDGVAMAAAAAAAAAAVVGLLLDDRG